MGFYTLAERLREQDLPLVMPKPISVRDFEVRIRMPLEQAQQQPENVPLHFTNLQLGLRQARQMLNRRGAANKQIFIITDGQPTAHVEPNASGAGDEMLYLLYPPTDHTSTITLKEALRCQQQGIRIATFALIEDYWGMDWVNFVERITAPDPRHCVLLHERRPFLDRHRKLPHRPQEKKLRALNPRIAPS